MKFVITLVKFLMSFFKLAGTMVIKNESSILKLLEKIQPHIGELNGILKRFNDEIKVFAEKLYEDREVRDVINKISETSEELEPLKDTLSESWKELKKVAKDKETWEEGH